MAEKTKNTTSKGIKLVGMTPQGKNADAVYKRICEDIEWLRAESAKETADGKASRARVLWYALAGFLEDHDILDDLKTTAYYMFEKTSSAAENAEKIPG